jgi:hypothetical protein
MLIALFAAVAYAFSPPMLHAVTHGLVGTIVVAMIAPLLIRSMIDAFEIESKSWRAVSAHALLYGLLLAFSPPAFIAIASWHFLLSAIQSTKSILHMRESAVERSIEMAKMLQRIIKRSLILVAAIAINIPWSLELLAYPSRALLEPGVSLEGAEPINLLLGNPGLNWWLFSAAPLIMIIALFRKTTQSIAYLALFLTFVGVLLSLLSTAGHGSSQRVSPSLGGVSVLFIGVALVAGLKLVDEVLPQIKSSALNFRHFATLAMAISVLATSLVAIGWWIVPGANGPLRNESTFNVPEFITANATTDERYKSLLIRQQDGRLLYWVVRDRALQLGDSDIVYGSSDPIDEAVAGLVTGAGIESSSILGQYGIRYLFLAQPINKGLARTIDGIGGFTRASSTDDGIVWKIVGATSRVSLQPFTQEGESEALTISLASGEVGAEGRISRPGSVTIAERFDERWRMLVNNASVDLTRSVTGLPQFDITEVEVSGGGDYIIYHDGTSRRGWLSLQFLILATLSILALPSRRRRGEVPIEELS